MRAFGSLALVIMTIALIVGSASATGTLTLSPDYDGLIQNLKAVGGETWSSVRDAATGTSVTIPPGYGVQAGTTSNKWRSISRAYLVFDTSGIPPGEDAYSVNFTFKVHSQYHEFGDQAFMDFVLFTPGNAESVAIGDYDQFGLGTVFDSYSISSFTTGSTYTISIDPDLIDPDGYTCIGIVSSYDTGNSPPGWISGKKDAFYIYDGTSELEVKYSSGVSIQADVSGTAQAGNTLTLTTTVNGYSGSESIDYYPELYNSDGALIWFDVDSTTEKVKGFDVYFPTAGNYSFLAHANVEDSDYYDWNNFTVSAATPTTSQIAVNLWEKYSNAVLTNQAVTVTPTSGGSSETKTSTYGETLFFDVVPGQSYWFNASRTGYSNYNATYLIPSPPGMYSLYMVRTLTPIANHSYAHFSVVDQTNGGLIPNAEIRLSDGQTKLTNSAGYAWFSVNNSEQINYYVSKPSGYWPAYGAMNLTADESILVALQRYTGPTATATMPGWTPVTVPTTGTGVDPVVTLSAQLRQQNVQEGMDVWYTNLPFISQFLFLLFIIGGLGLMAGGTRRN
jgi:hypothetical protein